MGYSRKKPNSGVGGRGGGISKQPGEGILGKNPNRRGGGGVEDMEFPGVSSLK